MKKYLLLLALLGIIGIGFGFYMYNKPHQNINRATSDIQIAAVQLFEAFEQNETEANTRFLDKIVEVSGVVKDVTKENGTINITLEGGSDMFGIICQLDNLTAPKRTEFKTGETVTFKGICTGVLMDVVMVRCVEI